MKEKLIIKNFGPIKSVEIELGRFNVLIGDQGTGKSTVAKVIEILNRYVADLWIESKGDFKNAGAKDFLTIASFENRLKDYSIENFLKNNSTISYIIDNVVVFELTDNRISPSFFESDYISSLMINWDFKLWNYIPADRGTSSLFHASTWADLLAANDGNIDFPIYFLRFYSLQDRAKRNKEEYDFTDTLAIKYRYAEGKEYFYDKEGNQYRLSAGSSAIQTNISLLTIVDWRFGQQFEFGNKIIIEEPELNFFPKTQNKVIEFLVEKTFSSNNSILITTHSPYTLTSLNNMMYAHELGQKHRSEVEKVIDEKYWLNPSEVSAYMMKEDGTCEDILDYDESGILIKADKIDGVSGDLNVIFDALIAIEHNEGIEKL